MSSSSSSEFSRPRPENGWYDVFLSFRGRDTRYGFTANLYHSLMANKVYTFMDIKLVGDAIDSLFKKIEKSKMAVIVYSESFASSDWCLRELDMIMQRVKDGKMLMIPIFYKVEVNELKQLKGNTGKYLEQLMSKHGETDVQKWKDVVTTLGHVSGLPYRHSRYEFDFITEVINKTKEKLEEWEKISHATEYDVFISFMGEDTHYTLVRDLYETLTTRKLVMIRTFMEYQDFLKDDTTFEAIQRSKIALVVFSRNYASSKWCLRELVKILQCSKHNTTRQLVVLPLFCLITPTDLINQADTKEGSKIAGQLEKHALDHEEATTVQSWREAITELGNIAGWLVRTSYLPAYGIGQLVEDISTRLDEKKESPKNQQACVSAKEESTRALLVRTNIEKGSASHQNIEVSPIPQLRQAYNKGSSSQSFLQTTVGEEVTGELLTIKPSKLYFIVEPEKPSSSSLVLTNKTDNYVSFKVKTTNPRNYSSVSSDTRLLLPRSTCKIIVTMVAQSVLPLDMVCTDKFLVEAAMIAKNDSSSEDDISNMFKKESGNAIEKYKMKVVLQEKPGFHL